MNDKQKELALELGVVACRWISSLSTPKAHRLRRESTELLAAFDAAADAPKRKYTVADIKKPLRRRDSFEWYIECGEYFYGVLGWTKCNTFTYSQDNAEVLYAGLVATGNVPEVGE